MKIIIQWHRLNPSSMLFLSDSYTLAPPLYFSVKPLCSSIKALGYTWDKPHFWDEMSYCKEKRNENTNKTAEDFTSSRLTHFFQRVSFENVLVAIYPLWPHTRAWQYYILAHNTRERPAVMKPLS